MQYIECAYQNDLLQSSLRDKEKRVWLSETDIKGQTCREKIGELENAKRQTCREKIGELGTRKETDMQRENRRIGNTQRTLRDGGRRILCVSVCCYFQNSSSHTSEFSTFLSAEKMSPLHTVRQDRDM